MSDYDREIYKILTSDSEAGRELNHKLFGDTEWSAVDRAEYLDKLKGRMEADSYQGGA